jgi:hypothetical protein
LERRHLSKSERRAFVLVGAVAVVVIVAAPSTLPIVLIVTAALCALACLYGRTRWDGATLMWGYAFAAGAAAAGLGLLLA